MSSIDATYFSINGIPWLGILVFCLSGCSLNERIHNMGPEVTADLIVYFKTDVTAEQIEGFWNRVLSYSAPDGHQSLRPGVGRLSRVEQVQGHEGIAIIFSGRLGKLNALNSDGILTHRRLCSLCLRTSLPKMSRPSHGSDIFLMATSNKALQLTAR